MQAQHGPCGFSGLLSFVVAIARLAALTTFCVPQCCLTFGTARTWSGTLRAGGIRQEGDESVILREVHLAGQLRQEMRAAQAVHDRALHLRQVQAHAHLVQPCVDRLQRLDGSEVDLFD